MITNFKRNNYVRDSVFCSSDMLKELAPNFECAQLKYGAIFILRKGIGLGVQKMAIFPYFM